MVKKIDYMKYSIICKSTDKSSFKVTRALLEKLWTEATEINKNPLLIISIPKNDKENFIFEGELKVRKK